jgi:two-component system, OmpR family, sensor histidine kinase VicK
VGTFEEGIKVVSGQVTTNTAIEFIETSKNRLDMCVDSLSTSSLVRTPWFMKAIVDAVARGVKYRHITKIANENLVYCEELQKYADLRHMDNIQGNFGVNENSYIAFTLLHEESGSIHELACSSVGLMVEQQRYAFETLWDKAIPAEQRIKEIQGGFGDNQQVKTSPFTNIIDSPEDIALRARQVMDTSKHMYVCSDFADMKMIEDIAYDSVKQTLKKAQEGKHRGIRWIGSIKNKEDIEVVRRFLALGVEIKHLESIPLNFSVTDIESNFTVFDMQEGSVAPSILVSDEQSYIRQFNILFEQLWSQGVNALDRIDEIEWGIESPKIEVIMNPQKTRQQYLDLANSAREEVLIILPTVNAFLRELDFGIIAVLSNISSRRGIKVSLISPFNIRIKEEISALERKGVAVQPNQKSSSSIFILLIVDKKYSLMIEVKDDSNVSFQKAIGMATFSNSKATVEPLVSIFEILWNQTELYEQLRMANEKLVLHDKMQDEFINIAAHELRTPIQPILALVELLGSQFSDQQQMTEKGGITREECVILARNAKRLQRLSSNILEVSRIESSTLHLNIEAFDLDQIIFPLVEDARNEINTRGREDNVKIIYSTSNDDVRVVKGDKDRISEVLWNLLDNAIKFTNRGAISIETGKYYNNHVMVSVKDNGSGIDSEVLPKLFSKFITKSEKGTGLGLFICKSIIEAHGGKIWAHNNNDGKGAIFSFTIPFAA